MKRSTIYCLIFMALFSFGFKLSIDDEVISKIYLVGTTLIRTTPGSHITLYDIADPASPKVLGSIGMEGNHDVAVRGKYMYADNNRDLVVYDIADRSRPMAIDTVVNTFNNYPMFVSDNTVFYEGGASGCGGCGNEVLDAPTLANTGGTGKAGSMSRFAIVGQRLYCVNRTSIGIYDISNPAAPKMQEEFRIGWEVETIFPRGDTLFLGGTEGMYIYDISNPDVITPISAFRHGRACDPVVVEGNRAYVTLRAGSRCGSQGNQLDILDITDVANPTLINTVPMTGPYGLAASGSIVLVCDGSAGVRIMDVADPMQARQVGAITGITPYDIILDGRLLVVTAESGFYLYDAADIISPKLYGLLR